MIKFEKVPSLKRAKKEALQILSSKEGGAPIWAFPITDMLVAYATYEPNLTELAVPIALVKALQAKEQKKLTPPFFIYSVAEKGKGKEKEKERYLVGIYYASDENFIPVFFYLRPNEDENHRLFSEKIVLLERELLNRNWPMPKSFFVVKEIISKENGEEKRIPLAVIKAPTPFGEPKELSLKVDNVELLASSPPFSKRIKQVLSSLLNSAASSISVEMEKFKGPAQKAAKFGLLAIGLGIAAYGGWWAYSHYFQHKEVKLTKKTVKPKGPIITPLDENLSFYEAIKPLKDCLLSVEKEGRTITALCKGKVPTIYLPFVRMRVGDTSFISFPLKVKPHKGVKGESIKNLGKYSYYYTANPLTLAFRAGSFEALKRFFEVRDKVSFSLQKIDGEYFLFVRRDVGVIPKEGKVGRKAAARAVRIKR